MNNNYTKPKRTKLSSFSKAATVGLVAMASCLVSSVAQAAAPLNNWNINSTVIDCFGEKGHYGKAYTSCQNYNKDTYENWNPNDHGAGDTDFKTFSLGSDDHYFYFELVFRKGWDYDNSGESRKYYLEIDDGTTGYYLFYQPKREDLKANWQDKGGSGEVEVYTGSPAKGYNNDLKGGKNLKSGDFYVRLVKGNVQLALNKKKIGSPSSISVRAYAGQNSTIEKDKIQWNKHNTKSDLRGFGGFDSTYWLSLNPNPPVITSVTPPVVPPVVLVAD